jgi:putative ATPase
MEYCMQLDVFSSHSAQNVPLAIGMRPKSIKDYVGQKTIIAQFERIIKNPHHVIFWGPPGCGKTTLAHILAEEMGFLTFTFSAVTSGIPELKKLIQEMLEQKKIYAQNALLFIDEIHRFNKAQQDALLPYLENQDFILVGATTEYPQTALNKALLSRVSVLELKSLQSPDLEGILERALKQVKREDLQIFCKDLAKFSNGDARFALNQLEKIISMDPEIVDDKEKIIHELFEHARQYDKNAHRHYDVISAFIKSMRGSDPEAALLYLAIMLDGGEDPEFIARRMMIFASEDIGLAQSQALVVANGAHYAVKNLGMPEARISLSHACLFLALSPKSNSSYQAINEAISFVKNSPMIKVPGHLSQNSPEKINYKYPHDFKGHWIDQSYLPEGHEKTFYVPSLSGSEKIINEQHKVFTGKAK